MAMACTIWRAMCRNGVAIGIEMIITKAPIKPMLLKIHKGQIQVTIQKNPIHPKNLYVAVRLCAIKVIVQVIEFHVE